MGKIDNFKIIGEHKLYQTCRFCKSRNVKKVIDLGIMPLAGGFIRSKSAIKKEKFYPLQLNFCKDCFLLQVNSSINPDILFKKYFYFSSSISTLIKHFENIAGSLKKNHKLKKGDFILEIGSNDGAFIKALQINGYKTLGIDPASNIVKPLISRGLPVVNSYFTEKLAKKILNKYGKADAIFSFHSMAHIEDMHDVMRGIKTVLNKNGFLAMEVHYLGNLLREKQYDMIYHEHQFYYSLVSLTNFFSQFDIEIFDIKRYEIRAGSIMFFAQHKGGPRKISSNLKKLLEEEKTNKLDKIETYMDFSKKINLEKKKLIRLVAKLSKEKKKIVGYGASGRGTIIANYCNLTPYMLYVIDDAKAKWGAFLPGTHHKIFPPNKMVSDKVDYAILFAWPFFNEVKKRNPNFSGKFILPLPTVKIT